MKPSNVLVAAFAAAFCAVTPPSARAGMLIAGSPSGTIYDIDPATGLATNPRDTGIDGLTGLAFSPDGVLYGRAPINGAGSDLLFRIDPTSGNATELGAFSESGFDFDFDPGTSLLFGTGRAMGSSGVSFYSIDPMSLAVRPIGRVAAITDSLAINPLGEFYVVTSRDDLLLLIDRSDGSILSSTLLGVDLRLAGTAFLPGAELLVVDGTFGSTRSFYVFDFTEETFALVAAIGVEDQLVALAYIPEPATVLLLLLGLCGCFFGRRRLRTGFLSALCVIAGLQMVALGDGGRGSVSSGQGEETGLGHPGTLLYAASVRGNFVAVGTSTRLFDGFAQDPVVLEVTDVPPDAGVIKAFVNL